MKIEWEDSDIKVGLKVKPRTVDEISIIGYVIADEGSLYTIISLSDGLVQPPTSKAVLATKLNNGNYIPVELDKLFKE